MRSFRLPEPLVPVLGVLGAVLCAWAAALARPRLDAEAAPSSPAVRAVVLDASGSAVRTRRGWGRWANRLLRDEALAARAAGEDLCVVQAAAEVRVAYGPGSADAFLARLEGRAAPFTPGLPPEVQHQSRIDEAVAAAGAALREPTRARGRLVMIVDRTYTGTDPGPRLSNLRRDGYGLTWHRLPAEDRPDLAALGLRLPRAVEPGAPAAALVELALSPGRVEAELALEVSVSGPGGGTSSRVAIAAPTGLTPGADGRRRWTVSVELPPRPAGRHRVGVRAVLASDTVPENDGVGDALWVGDGRVGLVVSSDRLGESTRRWLSRELPGLQLDPCPLEHLAQRLIDADLLVTVDLGPADLPENLGAWVREGGGWVALLGWRSLGSWERHGAGDPSDLLPLQPTQESGEDRDVILIVDGSGSMEGEPFERVKRAVFELVPAAQPSDRIELRFFTEVLHRVEFQSKGRSSGQRRDELAPLLDARVPRGGTDIGYSLQMLAQGREASDPRGLVLLLTDGVGSTGSAAEARRALIGARLDLRVLRIGAAPKGLEFLEGLLLPDEAVVEAGDLSGLGRLLQLEVNRHRVRHEPGMSVVAAPATGVLGQALLPSMTAAAPMPEDWATLATYARAEPVGEAEVLWRSSVEGEPVLAVHRVGAGLVAAAVTHPEWAPFLSARPALAEALFRAGARGRQRGGPRLVDGPEELVLEDCPVEWPVGLELQVLLPASRDSFDRLSERVPITVVPLLPGPGGSALDPRARRGTKERVLLDGLLRGTGLEGRLVAGGQGLMTLPLVAAGPAEWVGGGRPLTPDPPPPPAEPRPDPARAAAHPAAPWVLGAGTMVLAVAAMLALLGGQGILETGRR